MNLLRKARFVLGAHNLTDLPAPNLPEIVFAGRSNAGKSSAINQIVEQRRLAFTSKTPGRTQQINLFIVEPYGYLVDLPGYGYAKVPLAMRNHWDQVLGRYMGERQSLAGLVLIMDARHPLKPLDRQLLDYWLPSGRPVHILLSKADKLSRQEARKTLMTTRKALSSFPLSCSVQLFSALKKQGLDEARARIQEWLGATPAQSANTDDPTEEAHERDHSESNGSDSIGHQ